MLLNPCTFSPILPLPLPLSLPTDNPPCDLYFCDSDPVLVVCLVCSCFFLGSVVDSCEFVVILPFIFFIFFFKDLIYLCLERGERREKEERNTNVWLPLACPLMGT